MNFDLDKSKFIAIIQFYFVLVPIHLPNSNNGGATHFRLHPDQHIAFWSDAFSGTLELYRAVSEVGCGSTNIGQLSESPNHKP